MIIKVGEDDLSSLKSSPKWIAEHPARACVFGQAKETWAQLRTTYNGNFKGLVSGQLPPETEILDTLNSIYKRLLQVNWDIQQPLPPSS
ncbi:MAG TPA: hypothetical protein ENJ82_18140 [Bacteroidetes bacterium]|nr:hypothetical protein [Bacteroidota bacterium]